MILAEGLSKRFDATVLEDLSLEVPRGWACALSGPSGSGKSTLLRLVAGLDAPDSGRIVIGGMEVSAPGKLVAPSLRGVAIAFQRPALWPHMTVLQNVAFAAADGKRAERRALELLGALGLESLAKRKPQNLSGGEAQRAALARALAPRREVLLLDEPFSNLDPASREKAVALLEKERAETGWTLLMATHDAAQVESICDRRYVLREGRASQEGGQP